MILPVGHRVVIKQEKLEEADPTYKKATQLGIVIAEHDDKKREQAGFDKGTVIAIGPDAWKAFYLNSNPQDSTLRGFEPWCKIGDKVAFAKYSGKTVKDPEDHQDYMVLNDEDIVCVIKESV
jgi:co-chaperonin GroES (HSP10)